MACDNVLTEDIVLTDGGKLYEKTAGLEDKTFDPPKEVNAVYSDVEPKHLKLPVKIEMINYFSIDTCTIINNNEGKPTLICDISKNWNYKKNSNVLEKLAIEYMGLLV